LCRDVQLTGDTLARASLQARQQNLTAAGLARAADVVPGMRDGAITQSTRDRNAALIALIAIIVAALSPIFAATGLLSLLFIGSGLAILGSGGMLRRRGFVRGLAIAPRLALACPVRGRGRSREWPGWASI